MSARRIAPTLSRLLKGNRIGEITSPRHPALAELRALLAVARSAKRLTVEAGHLCDCPPEQIPDKNGDLARALARLARTTAAQPKPGPQTRRNRVTKASEAKASHRARRALDDGGAGT